MEKIERYLDQACHGIAGPRALRAHIRQELKEHLLDAIAQHKDAGMSDDDALTRALEDFGGPDLVRSELEATHGHRLMTVVLDKALLWKEKTMKARWLWSSAALTTLLLTITLQCFFIVGVDIVLFPKYQQMVQGGWLTDSPNSNGIVTWSVKYLMTTRDFVENALFLIVPLAIAWFLFEWRVRSENKSFIRLSLLGILSVALMVVAFFTGVAISLPPLVALDSATSEGSEQLVRESLDNFNHTLAQLDRSAAAGDWDALQTHVQQINNIPSATPAVLTIARERGTYHRMVTNLRETRSELHTLANSIVARDAARMKDSLQHLHAAYDPIRQLIINDATRPAE